jgi:4-amino-4-deoxy-L-arabinose transferase-like glycosyltransferase
MPGPTRLRLPSVKTILALAFLVRALLFLAAWLRAGGFAPFHSADTAWYVSLAGELAAGGRFWSGGGPEMIRTPGYPLLIVPGLLGGQLELVTVALQIILSCATCYLVYLTARSLTGGEWVGALAALLCAVEPLGVLYSVMLLSETLFTLLVVAAIYLLVAAMREGGMSRFALAAVCVAAAAYARPVAYLLPLVLALALAVRGALKKDRRLLAGAALSVAVSFVLVGAWQVRNARVGGYGGFSAVGDFNAYFHLTAALKAKREGRAFYDCLTEIGFYDREVYFSRHPEQRDWPPGERYRFMRREGLAAALADPRLAAGLYAKGLLISLADPGAVEYLRLLDLYPRKGRLLDAVVSAGVFSTARQLAASRPLVFWSNAALGLLLAAYYLLAARGLWLVRRHPVTPLLVLTLAYLALAAGGTVGSARLRAPVMPFVAALAACGLAALRRTARSLTARG